MTWPAAAGRKQTVTERGWFAPPFTACRFAVEAQVELRMGRDLPLALQPYGADNAVRDLQVAGDPTLGTGSTIRQGQAAIRKLIPDSDMKWGWMTPAELLDAVKNHGATVGFGVDCAKWPRYLRVFVGFAYTGGHYVCVDGVDDTGTEVVVDLNDPMDGPTKHRPNRVAQPRRRSWTDVLKGVSLVGGLMRVTLGYENESWWKAQLVLAEADLAAAETAVADLEAKLASVPQ